MFFNVSSLSFFFFFPLSQVSQVPDQEIPEEEQSARLAARGGQQQGELRVAVFPDQPGRGRGGRGRLKRQAIWSRFVYPFFPEIKLW